MNSGLSSAVPDFSKARRPSESSNEPSRRSSKLNLITRARSGLDKLLQFPFVRYLIAFFIGIAAALAWQSYSGGARQAIAGWSPHLSWLAPATPARASADHRKATAASLGAMRQEVERLTREITKLQAIEQSTPDQTLSRPPSRAASRRL